MEEEELDFPPIVYKYRSWEDDYHKRILTENQVYLSPPDYFNDPFDCRVGRNFSLLDTDEKKKEFARRSVQNQLAEIAKRGETPDFRYTQFLTTLHEDLEGVQERDDEYTDMLMGERFGVLSLSALWDNILMWSHYGKFHQGFCVGFHEEMIRNSDLFGKGASVFYTDDFPEISPLNEDVVETMFYRTHFKAKDWEYEKEYRLATTFPGQATKEQRTVTLPDEFYSEIVLGIKCPEEHRNEIIEIADHKSIPVFQAIKAPFKFKIGREQIA